MSYREHMHGLATAVAELVQHGASVAPADLPAALTAHAALGDLLREVHASVSEIHATPASWTTLAHVEQHPVAVLGVLLRQHARIAPVPLSEVIAGDPLDNTAGRWRSVAQHASLALHDWTSSTTASRPQGAARWSEAADVAALAEALTPLTSDLAASAQAAGRMSVADQLHRATASGLGIAARQVRDIAAGGPLPALGDLRALPSRRILPVRSADDVTPALDRLGHLLRTSASVSPAHVQLVARVLAVASQDTARTLAAVGGAATPAAEALDRHGAALGRVTSSPRRVASLTPGDPAALHQAQLVHHALADLRRRAIPLTESQAVDVGRTACAASQSLSRIAQAQVRARTWLTPVPHEALAIWGAITPGQEPELLRSLRAAHRSGRRAASLLPAPNRLSTWPAPRSVLATALDQSHPRQPRPGRPHMPTRRSLPR